MKAKFINETHIEGWIYEHKLEKKVTGPASKNPGTEFISGTISIATDNAMTNIVPVHYTYITATTSSGNSDSRFTALSNVIDGTWKNVMEHGKDVATKVKIDSAIGVNDFYTERNGEETLVTAKRNESGFIHAENNLKENENERGTFTCDMVITATIRTEADPENNRPERMTLRGCTFDFRKAILPIELTVLNPVAMDYFESLDISSHNPVFTKIWGRQVSTVSTVTKTEESAFGEAKVTEVQNTRKDWVVTGAAADPYVWDDESTITAAELNTAMAERESHLADVHTRWKEYQDNKKAPSAATTSTGFNF